MKPSIVVLGSINMDLVLRTPHLPATGETVSARDIHYIAGGKGLNQAVAAARLDSHVTLIGKVGADAFGATIIRFLKSEPHLLTEIRRTPTSTGLASIVVDTNGNNTIIVLPGSNAKVDSRYVHGFHSQISHSDGVLSQLEIPDDAIYTFFQLARKFKKITLLNASPAKKLSRSLLGLTDYFVVNETELAFYSHSSSRFTAPRSVVRAARKLVADGQTIVVTLGKKGCIAVQRNAVHMEKGVSVKTVDTTAAGDCFVGALMSGLVRHEALPDALRFANRAAALSTTRLGASSSLPTLKEYNQAYSS